MDVLGVLAVLPLLFLRNLPEIQTEKRKLAPPSRSIRAPRITSSVRPFQILSPRGMLIPMGDVSSAWRGNDGIIYVNQNSLSLLGLTVVESGLLDAVELSTNGHGTFRIETTKAPGRQWDRMLRLSDIASATRSRIMFDPKLPLARLQTTVSTVFAERESVRITSHLPIRPNLTRDKVTGKLIVDIPGANVEDIASPTVPDGALYKSIRIGQYQDNIARVVIETSDVEQFKLTQGESASEWIVTTATKDSLPASVTVAPTTLPSRIVRSASLPLGNAPFVTAVSRAETMASPHGVDFVIETPRLAWFRPMMIGNQFILDLNVEDPSIILSDMFAKVDNGMLGIIECKTGLGWGTRIVISLNQPTRFIVSLDSRGRIRISLREQVGEMSMLPLVGKTILVDPGHGGSTSSGTKGVDGRFEKQNTLPIALAVASRLDVLGANVVITRDNDTDPGLKERPAIANRVDADAFVSIHCNDSGRGSASNGSLVFYHMDSQPCLDLAKSVSERLGLEVSTIKRGGIRSDKTVYKNDGFAVLRLSTSVGVLVEAGFMSNASDASALASPPTQQAIGTAVANGILDYFVANPSLDTRYVKGKAQKESPTPPEETAPPTEIPF